MTSLASSSVRWKLLVPRESRKIPVPADRELQRWLRRQSLRGSCWSVSKRRICRPSAVQPPGQKKAPPGRPRQRGGGRCSRRSTSPLRWPSRPEALRHRDLPAVESRVRFLRNRTFFPVREVHSPVVSADLRRTGLRASTSTPSRMPGQQRARHQRPRKPTYPVRGQIITP